MKYGLATHNRYIEIDRKQNGEKLRFKVCWNVATDIQGNPRMWDTEKEVHEEADEQVWDYKVLEFTDDGEMTQEIENFKTHKPKNT